MSFWSSFCQLSGHRFHPLFCLVFGAKVKFWSIGTLWFWYKSSSEPIAVVPEPSKWSNKFVSARLAKISSSWPNYNGIPWDSYWFRQPGWKVSPGELTQIYWSTQTAPRPPHSLCFPTYDHIRALLLTRIAIPGPGNIFSAPEPFPCRSPKSPTRHQSQSFPDLHWFRQAGPDFRQGSWYKFIGALRPLQDHRNQFVFGLIILSERYYWTESWFRPEKIIFGGGTLSRRSPKCLRRGLDLLWRPDWDWFSTVRGLNDAVRASRRSARSRKVYLALCNRFRAFFK